MRKIKGSPPHARGAGQFSGSVCIYAGITPACAGSSVCRYMDILFRWDHPRMRGEQLSSRPPKM